MKKIILCTIIGIVFLSCSNADDSEKDFLVFYNQTQCADIWGYADNNEELADKIVDYLKSVNIQISNVKIDNKGTPQLCNACSCLSGKRIITKVSENDLNSIKEYGFQEFN